jgi:hypothetical protein
VCAHTLCALKKLNYFKTNIVLIWSPLMLRFNQYAFYILVYLIEYSYACWFTAADIIIVWYFVGVLAHTHVDIHICTCHQMHTFFISQLDCFTDFWGISPVHGNRSNRKNGNWWPKKVVVARRGEYLISIAVDIITLLARHIT